MSRATCFSLGRRHDYRLALAAVEAPALVLHGAQDLQSEAASRTWVDAFPNARIEVLGDAGHHIFRDAPAAFAQLVGDQLR